MYDQKQSYAIGIFFLVAIITLSVIDCCCRIRRVGERQPLLPVNRPPIDNLTTDNLSTETSSKKARTPMQDLAKIKNVCAIAETKQPLVEDALIKIKVMPA